MDLRFRCFDPTDPRRPYPQQAQFLRLDRLGRDTNREHYVGGRGCAKTTTGIILACRASLEWMPGFAGIWTEPTYRHCIDIFLREFKKLVPSELYKYSSSDMRIDWRNGSTIDIRSRNVDNPGKEINKGPNYAWGIEDEIAYKFDLDKYWDLDLAIRDPSATHRFHACLTTPKMNRYYNLATSEDHTLIRARSLDNPFLPEGWVDSVASQMTAKRRAQELEGEWVSLTGRIWDTWSADRWPMGNTHDHVYDKSIPYFLFFDLGVASSAWLIVQRLRDVWVAVAEYTPKRDGSVDRVLAQIKRDYGIPCKVVAGADLNTRSSTDAMTSQHFVNKHFGAIPTVAVSGWIADKEIQQAQLSYMICDSSDYRRLCISRKFKSHNPEENRGLVEVMTQDTWPEEKSNRTSELLPKDGRLEHMRDALLYGCVGAMEPPSMKWNQPYAA
jgi:hypothetical protein